MTNSLLLTILLSSSAPSASSSEDPAVIADRCESREPHELWQAAKAYSNAGRDARAIVCWRRALAAGLAGADADAARASLRDALRRTAPLTLRIGPVEPSDEALLEFSRPSDVAPFTVKLAELRDLAAGTFILHIEPFSIEGKKSKDRKAEAGEWQLRLVHQDAAYNTASARILVDSIVPKTVDLELTLTEHRVRFILPAGGPTSVTLRLKHTTAPTWIRNELIRSPKAEFSLPAGTWTYTVEAVGYTGGGTFAAVADASTVTLELAADPPPPAVVTRTPPVDGPPELLLPRERKILGGSILGVAFTSVAIGTGFLVWGTRRGFACAADDRTCQYALDSVGGVSVGSAMIGAGVGASVAAITALRARQRRPFVGEAIAGGALLLGGGAWYLGEIFGCYDLGGRPRDHIAAALLGAGAGMLTASTVNLLIQRRSARGRLVPQPTVSSTTIGLTLHARF